MKIFIIEDSLSMIKNIKNIIIERELGNFLGYAIDGVKGLEQIKILRPDIVLIDIILPNKDGLTIINEIKKIYPEINFIVISKLSSKEVIAKAFKSGCEYFIIKPINIVELEIIIKKVKEKIYFKKTINDIKKLLDYKEGTKQNKFLTYGDYVKTVMQQLGILGEVGSNDIVNILTFIFKSNKNVDDFNIGQLCSKFTDSPKSMEQRIRRTAAAGLNNIASLGIEDYANTIFSEYSNSIYTFDQVKIEMDFIRKKSNRHGKINLKKFIHRLSFYCENNYFKKN